MGDTHYWALPLLAAGQAQKEITHNEAIVAIDRLLHLSAISRRFSLPPIDAVPGAIFIVAAEAEGEWLGQTSMLAIFDGGGWTFSSPREGCLAWIADEAQFGVFTGGQWSDGAWPAQGLQVGDRRVLSQPAAEIAVPSGGAIVDSECRAVLIALMNTLGNQGVIRPFS